MTWDVVGFYAHLQTAQTTVCRAWDVGRKDGETYGFTDHDLELNFDGVTYAADTGLSASAVEQSTGLAVDNTEAIGAISSLSITEEDVDSGRFDGAAVRSWLVNWRNPNQRELQFSGSIGQIRRQDGVFIAELRGEAEKLNQPLGRVYHREGGALLADGSFNVDLEDTSYVADVAVAGFDDCRFIRIEESMNYPEKWFERGFCFIVDGAARNTQCLIKSDRINDGVRVIQLWEPLRRGLAAGDQVKLVAGTDHRSDTARLKFNNIIDFQGFPFIPGEDWLISFPSKNGNNDGGSLTS